MTDTTTTTPYATQDETDRETTDDEPFEGVYPAMTTPFTDDDEVDHEQLAANARYLERAGVDGVVPVGSTGESATMSHDEHVDVIETVRDALEDVPVVAGTGSNNTAEALSLSERAADAGPTASSSSPYYNKPEPQGFLEHYRTIADESIDPADRLQRPEPDGPIDPHRRDRRELAEHPNIQGYKAASGDLNLISEVIERTRDEEFSVLSGDGLTPARALDRRHRHHQRRRQRRAGTLLRDGRRALGRLRPRAGAPPRALAARPRTVRRDESDPGEGGDAHPRAGRPERALAAQSALRGPARDPPRAAGRVRRGRARSRRSGG